MLQDTMHSLSTGPVVLDLVLVRRPSSTGVPPVRSTSSASPADGFMDGLVDSTDRRNGEGHGEGNSNGEFGSCCSRTT